MNTDARRAGLLTAGVLLLAAGGWLMTERRWQGDLYCFERPGWVWGLSQLPPGAAAECPASRSYRQEIRQGLGRVEQYRLKGWQPRALLGTFTSAGYHQQTDDLLRNDYAAFLARGTDRIQYSAVRQGEETLITVSGLPHRP